MFIKILAIFPVLYITPLYLIYFIPGDLYLLILFPCFAPPLPHPASLIPSLKHSLDTTEAS